MSAARGGIAGLRPYSNYIWTSWKGVLVALLVFNAKSASANPLPGVSENFNNVFPTKNITGGPVGEIQCYALPYGAVGMISHLFTYWTIAWMGVSRTPMWPPHKMDHSKFDMTLSAIGLLTCIPVATISIHRCRLSWHFILIGIWKLTTSVTQGCVAVHRALIVASEQRKYQPVGPAKAKQLNYSPLWWLILYFLGTITGMVGLIGLITADFRHNPDVRSLTYGFLVVITVLALTTGTHWYMWNLEKSQGGHKALKTAYIQVFRGFFVALLAAFGFFSPLYSDLVLGAIAQNWSGFPSQDNLALYWTWFAAKRLPMFSY